MRTFTRIGAVVVMASWTAVGCGSINAVSPDGGGAGTSGNAGTTGAAGTNGGPGQGGAGGGTVNLACPDNVPNDQGPCLRDGLQCEYGDDPRGDLCRIHAVCSSLHWKVTKPDANSCPAISYGRCSQPAGGTCSPEGSYCVQPDGVDCQCTSCPPSAPVCTAGLAPHLYCVTNGSPGCPPAEPNVGTACNAPDGTECAYCPDASRVCSKGIWTPGNPCIRPL